MTNKNTRYSRSTWKKNQLRQSMSVPNLGNSGCSLCYDRSIPSNLNAHVSDSQTCADVHLQLALLRYNNALCAVGQAQYQDTCCPQKKKSPAGLRTTGGFLVGAILVAVLVRKMLTSFASTDKRRRSKERGCGDEGSDDDSDGSLRASKSSESDGGRSTGELEMPTSRYQRMEDPNVPIRKTRSRNSSRSRSSGKPRSRPRSVPPPPTASSTSSRPRSRSRGDRSSVSDRIHASSRTPSRSSSRGRTSRPRSRSRSKSTDRRKASSDHHHRHHERGTVPHRDQQYEWHRPLPPQFQHGHHSEDVEVASQLEGPDLIIPTQLL
jgi:hypothetical protein